MTRGRFILLLAAAATCAFFVVGMGAGPAHATSCSVSKTNSTVGVNSQAEGVLANTSVRPSQLDIGGLTMNWTSGPFNAGGGLWETTYASSWNLTSGTHYEIEVGFGSGICSGGHDLGSVTAQ